MQLDASSSYDPDGNNLHYNWYVYEEPGTYKGVVEIESDKQGMCVLHIPEDATGKNFHLILELNDDGVPSLTGYRRFVIYVNDENKRGCPFKQPLFFEYRRYFLYSLWLLILIIKLPHRWK